MTDYLTWCSTMETRYDTMPPWWWNDTLRRRVFEENYMKRYIMDDCGNFATHAEPASPVSGVRRVSTARTTFGSEIKESTKMPQISDEDWLSVKTRQHREIREAFFAGMFAGTFLCLLGLTILKVLL